MNRAGEEEMVCWEDELARQNMKNWCAEKTKWAEQEIKKWCA